MAQLRIVNPGAATRTITVDSGTSLDKVLSDNGIDIRGKSVVLNGVAVTDPASVSVVEDGALMLASAVKGG